MLNDINIALELYEQKWQRLISVRHERKFFMELRPTAVGWKVADKEAFDSCMASLQDQCDQIHLAWLDDRWLATLHLCVQELSNATSIIKIMQRRPGSDDSTGLDHVDFMIPDDVDAKSIVSAESDLKWSEEKNGEHCKWISVWFDYTEAKLRRDTVLQVCADELLATQTEVLDTAP